VRPKSRMRTSRRVYAAAFAVMLAIPATAVALTASPSTGGAAAVAPTDTTSAIKTNLTRRHVDYGKAVTIKGAASPAQPGQKLELRSTTAGSRSWRTVASATERHDGSFRMTTPMRRSARLRVVSAAGTASAPQRVTVAARLQLQTDSIDVVAGHSSAVRGTLLPGISGRKVRLEGRQSDGSWRPLTTDRTGSRGGFGLHYAGGDASSLRVHFAGDRQNTRAAKPAGQVTVFEPSMASWYYDDTGATACGFQAHYGVANRTLPCGTKVRLRNGSHEVTATVDDRGPFVSGRTWDLGINTRNALGFVGIGSIWASM
jgi:rare lipoprotein A